MNKLLKLSITLNAFEWYEFTIYAFLTNVIQHVFFSNKSNIIGMIYSLAIFTISYLIRPVGSIFWGYIADKYQTATALRFSTLWMTIPTFFIGILPVSYLGVFYSPILLLFLRIIQGFAAGGELPLSGAYIYECTKNHKYCKILCSFVNIGGMFGVLLASLVVFLLYLIFNEKTITLWAWRIPFLLGLPISFIILNIRKSMISLKVPSGEKLSQSLFKDTLNKNFINAFLIFSFLQATFYTLIIWTPMHLEQVKLISLQYVKLNSVVSIIVLAIFSLFFAVISNYVDYKKLMMISAISVVIFVYPLFLILLHSKYITFFVVQIIFAMLIAPIQGSYIYAFSNIFRGRAFNKCMCLSFTLPTALFGGTAPIVCSYFVNIENISNFPSIYLIVFGILAIPAIYFL